MVERRFESFEDFWPHYVGEHQQPATRLLHFAGTTAAMGCLAGALLFRKRWLLALVPIVGYGPSWAGHFFFEKNMPATFRNPLWSLRGDLRMWHLTIRGRMQAEVDRVAAEREREAAQEAEQEAAATTTRRHAVN